MAWSRIQSAKTAATMTGAATGTATFTTNLSSGTKIIAAVSVSVGSATTVSGVADGNGNSLTLIGRKTTASLQDTSLWAMDTPAGDAGTTPAITATLTGGTGQISIVIQEVSGLLSGNTTAMADGTLGSKNGTGGSSTGSPTYTSTASDEYLVSVYGDDGGPETWTKPSALTADANSINGNSYADCAIAYGNSTDAAEAGSWALTGTSAEWATLLVAFKLASTSTITAADSWSGVDTATAAQGGTGYDTWAGTDTATVAAQSSGGAPPVLAVTYSPAGATSLTVTAAQSGTGTGDGIALTVKVITSANGSPIGNTAESVAVTTPELAITPDDTGSWVYGALVNGNATAAFTAAASTTFSQNQYWSGDATTFATFRSTGTTTASTPVTLGATAPAGTAGQFAIALLEIIAASDETLAEDASSPAVAYTTTATTVATASFAPPAGALLVAMVASDCSGTSGQSMTMGVTDSSGLTWTRRVTGTITSGTGTFQVATVWTAIASSSSGGDWTTGASPKTQTVTAAVGDVIVVLGGSQAAATTLALPAGGPAAWIAGQFSAVTGYCAGYAWSSVVPGLSQGGGTGPGTGTGTAALAIAVTTVSLPTAQVGQAYTATLAAAGGTGTGLTWSVTSGSLPAGLTLSASGVISGTPAGSASTGSVTVAVTDSGGNTATSQALTMTVITGPDGPSGDWTLAFADEFDVPYVTAYGTGPDPNTWADHYINGDLGRSPGSPEVEWFCHGYYGHSVANSVWTATAQYQNAANIDPTAGNALSVTAGGASNPTFTSGMISGHLGGPAITYGYFEARVQQPSPSSAWCAFWLLTRGYIWPPEIDVAEWQPPGYSGQNQLGYYNMSSTWQAYYQSGDENWDVWGCEITASTVTYYKNGSEVTSHTYDGNAFPWYVIVNLGVNAATSGSGYPATYSVDYIRAWVPSGVPAAPVITAISPATGVPSGGDVTVTFGTVSGATSYRVTASPTDCIQDNVDDYGNDANGLGGDGYRATGSTSPITVTGLPSGGRWNFTVCAINSTGYSPESAPAGPQIINIQMATPVLPFATAGEAYSATLTATAGVTPYTWSYSGSLPAGLTLNTSTGVISGTPTAAGASSFTVKVTGSTSWTGGTTAANSATAALSITTYAAGTGTGGGGTTTLSITTTSLPSVVAGTSYSQGLTATGGTGTYTWSVISGALPSWATLNASTGVISGNPSTAGTSNFTVQVTDSGGNTATQALSITVTASSSAVYPSWDPGNTQDWTTQFDDEFTEASLNTTYWGAGWQAKTGISGPINSTEPVTYSSNNVSVSGGYLNLALIGTSGAGMGACVTTNTNGTGGSTGFAASPPAAFEARINVQGATSGGDVGIYNWPAFWTDGQSWPADGEIDVLEGLDGYAAYHVHDSAGGPGGNVGALGDYIGWHTFGCYRTATEVTFYYDGVEVGSESANFSEPHYLILNYTTSPDAGDPLGTMQVDWVRVWTPG